MNSKSKRFFGFFALVIVVILVLMIPREEEASAPAGMKDSLSTVSEPEPAKAHPKFAYLGRKRFRGLSETTKKEPSGGNLKDVDGKVPELTIDASGSDLESIAGELGYVLVAVDSVVLGRIVGDRLVRMTPAELVRYSLRARDAEGIPKAARLKEAIGRTLAIPEWRIRLMYLVPLGVDNRFIQLQMSAIREAGLIARDVRQTMARYVRENGDLTIEITSMVRKDGHEVDN